MQHPVNRDAGDECGMAGANVGSKSSGSDFSAPADNGETVEDDRLGLAVQSPVKLEGEKMLRIGADFVHRLIFVADPGFL